MPRGPAAWIDSKNLIEIVMRAISFYWTLNPVETALWNSNCEDVGTQDPVLRPSTHHKQRSWSTSMVQDIGDSQLVNGINRSLAILSTAPLLNLQRCQLWWTLPCFSRDEEPFKTRQLDWQRQKERGEETEIQSVFLHSFCSICCYLKPSSHRLYYESLWLPSEQCLSFVPSPLMKFATE